MQRYYSKIYWHFTGGPEGLNWHSVRRPSQINVPPKDDRKAIDALENILKEGTLRATCTEKIAGYLETPKFCCVCDIPFKEGRLISPPSVAEQRAAIELQLEETLKLHEASYAGGIFRKFGVCYAALHPMREEVRQAFINAKTTDSIRNILASWYDDRREWPAVKPRGMLRDLIAAGAAE